MKDSNSRLTPADIRQMPASQVIDPLEERLGVRLPVVLHPRPMKEEKHS